jgi:hypothetical protein
VLGGSFCLPKNQEHTHSLVTSPLTQIEFKSFPGIVGRYLLVFADVAFYRTWSVLPCSRMLCRYAFRKHWNWFERNSDHRGFISVGPLEKTSPEHVKQEIKMLQNVGYVPCCSILKFWYGYKEELLNFAILLNLYILYNVFAQTDWFNAFTPLRVCYCLFFSN